MQDRYQSQIKLYNFGQEKQAQLAVARVLVVGAGGLAASLLSYLAAAGVGYIDIIDFDTVEISNLNRQTLYTADDIGKSKAKIAAARLAAQNRDIKINFKHEKLDNSNALTYISTVDLVLDACDNFTTRYIINDACIICKKTWIYAAISDYSGQIATFDLANIDHINTRNYRDLHPIPPIHAINCTDSGILGAVSGIIGSMQAMEAIKYLCNMPEVRKNTLIFYDALHNNLHHFEINANSAAYANILPQNETEFKLFDYINHSKNKIDNNNLHISLSKLRAASESGKKILIIDLRERTEIGEDNNNFDFLQFFDCLNLPFSRYTAQKILPQADILVFFCPQGKRSEAIARIARANYKDRQICALQMREG